MAGLAGKAGSLTIGAASYPITQWDLDVTSELLEDSNSKSSGRNEFVEGFSGATGSFTAYYDPDDNPIPSLDPGSGTVTLILGLSATKDITVPALVSSTSFSTPIKGKIEFTCSFTATGFDTATELDAL